MISKFKAGDEVIARRPGYDPFVGVVIDVELNWFEYSTLVIEGNKHDYPVETDKNPVVRVDERLVFARERVEAE